MYPTRISVAHIINGSSGRVMLSVRRRRVRSPAAGSEPPYHLAVRAFIEALLSLSRLDQPEVDAARAHLRTRPARNAAP
jgi:hypothetical protein